MAAIAVELSPLEIPLQAVVIYVAEKSRGVVICLLKYSFHDAGVIVVDALLNKDLIPPAAKIRTSGKLARTAAAPDMLLITSREFSYFSKDKISLFESSFV